MKRRVWLLYLCVGVAALVAFLFTQQSRQDWIFILISLSSPVAIVVAIRMWRPVVPAPWILFAAAQSLFLIGDLITYNYVHIFGTELHYPSVGDLVNLLVYPCLIGGLLMLYRRRNPGGRDRDSVIDSMIVAIGIGTMQWVFLMSPVAHDSVSTLLQKLVGMAYPFMDLVLFMIVLRFAMGGGRKAPALHLMLLAAGALFLADTLNTYISVQGLVYNQTGYLEAGWGLFSLLWGAAALHPSMRMLSDKAPEGGRRLSRIRLLLLASATLMAPAVMFIQYQRNFTVDMPILISASVALFILVVIRMADLVTREELSAVREKALRTVGATLVTATSRENIYSATLEAARSLLGDEAGIRLLVATEDRNPNRFLVVAAAGGIRNTEGSTVSLSVLPQWKRDRLQSHQSYEVAIAESELAGMLGMPQTAAFVLTAPLFMKEELEGLLIVAGPAGIPREIRDSIESLSSQVALALDSALTTEVLLRRQSEARFSSLVQNSSDLVMVVDADSTIRYISPSVDRVLGHEAFELEGTKLTVLVHPEDRASVLQFLATGARDGDPHPGLTEFRMRHRDEFWLHVESVRTNLLHDENVKGIVLNTRDVSERKAFEEQLAHQAFHDAVTGLANRALFKDRVEHAVARQAREGRPVLVLFMDLDDFKTINDSLGHAAGDHLLAEVGDRLRGSLRAADTAARLGGDEFAILLEEGAGALGAAEVAARILSSLEGPFHLEGKEVFVRASIGIASADSSMSAIGPDGAEELLRNADVAMYMAKEAGKSRYQLFEPAMHDTALRRLELKADLQRAVDSHEFVLHYQPVIELETGRIEGFEALVRWMHPARGVVPPLDFIPLAEETGLIVPIGHAVLAEACTQARRLQARYPSMPPLHMSVNLSARQLQRPELVGEIADVLMDTGLEPDSLVLEITESVMMQDMDLSIQRLAELKALGVKLAVDDFGTGYSSLNYLRRFPVDILKVDKSFVDSVNEGGEVSALTAAIIELAGILRLRPVAEGIERADQLEKLLALKCDLGQGYYFARPLPLEGIDDLLSVRQTLAHREHQLSIGPPA
jgi:diguanylate cyclase (GGDEF)-like protein/PAS domain S-box-containing protein